MKGRHTAILECIIEKVTNKGIKDWGPGLHNGKSGIALLLFYYSRLTKKRKYAVEGGRLIFDSFKAIEEGYDYSTFCDGVAGFAWVVEHLVQEGFIKREEVPFLNDIDDPLYKEMMREIRDGEFDFLHGAIGIGAYFLSRAEVSDKCAGFLDDLIAELDKLSVKEISGEISWVQLDKITEDEKQFYCNMGLAHGMASIVSFLSFAIKYVKNKKLTSELISGAIKYILNHQLDRNKDGISFPNIVSKDNVLAENRKVGWCNGDTGVSIALYNAGKALKNEKYKRIALDILLETTKLNNPEELFIEEPGICHGSIGLSHMYNRMYFETKMAEFHNASNLWMEETLKMNTFGKLLKSFENLSETDSNETQHSGVLTGLSGIGLTLISSKNNSLDWDRCLFLS